MKFRSILVAATCVALAACGGGGDDKTETVALQSGTVHMSAVERNTTTGDLAITVRNPKAGSAIYLQLEGGRTVLSDFEADPSFSDVEHITLTTRADLTQGGHQEVAKLHVCLDQGCQQEMRGSPLSVTLLVDVSPNIDVAPITALTRTGADPAPAASIPVTVPAAAGAVLFSPEETSNGVTLSWADGAIQVATTQQRAGTYEATGHLAGANPLYSADVTVQYTVLPPAGGEHGMSVDMPAVTFNLSQGDVKTQRLVVTRPTWTNDYTPLALTSGCDAMYTLTDLGGGSYQVTANAVGLPVGVQHYCTLVASAGDASVGVSLQSNVGLAFAVGNPQGFTIPGDTPPAPLVQALPVTMTDGSALAWTASTTAPWLQLARTSGTTGVDALTLQVDTSHLADQLPGDTAHVTVSVGRPDVPPQDIAIPLGFAAPYVRDLWTTGLKTSGRARLYLNGQFDYNVGTNGTLSVSGARVLSTKLISDPGLLGNTLVLQVDVDQVVAGQAVTATLSSPWLTTQSSVTMPAPSLPAGFVALPFGDRKPASFSPANAALYLAGADTVWRVGTDGSTWTSTSASRPGVLDVDPRPDEKHLLAVGADGVSLLDPLTLQPVWSGVPMVDYVGNPAVITGAGSIDSKSVLHTSDGYGWVTYSCVACSYPNARGVAQLSLGYADTVRPAAAVVNLSRGAYSRQRSDGSFATPLMVGSAGRKTVLATYPQATSATSLIGDTMNRWDIAGYPYAQTPGLAFGWPDDPASVSDDGQFAISTGGWTWGNMGQYFMLKAADLVPAGQVAEGWSMSSDGWFILVYTVQLSGTGDAQVATQPTLHVIELNHFNQTLLSPGEIAAVPLAGVPGCGLPRAAGQACVPRADVQVDPSGTVAFVSGDQGVAIVPLPARLATFQGLRGRDRAKAAASQVHPLGGSATVRH